MDHCQKGNCSEDPWCPHMFFDVGKVYKYKFDNADVVVIQINIKKERVEISRDLITKINPFWVDFDDLTNNYDRNKSSHVGI